MVFHLGYSQGETPARAQKGTLDDAASTLVRQAAGIAWQILHITIFSGARHRDITPGQKSH